MFSFLLLNIGCSFSFGHCIVCPSSMDTFWLLYCLSFFNGYLLTIVLSVLLQWIPSDHCIVCPSSMDTFWPLYCLFFFNGYLLTIVLSVLLQWIPSDHCIVCSSSMDTFWLSFWYLQTSLLVITHAVANIWETKRDKLCNWTSDDLCYAIK
jgi:hypothetical protein